MDNGSSPSLFPLHLCKTIHLVGTNFDFDLHTVCCRFDAAKFLWFEGHSRLSSFLDFSLKSSHGGLTNPCIQVRHGQGIHNVEGAKNHKELMKPEYFDAHLTPLGWQQVGRRH